jgi:Flp pilus assembly protein TadD
MCRFSIDWRLGQKRSTSNSLAQFLEDKDRKVVPRWRSSGTTIALGELNAAGPIRGRDLGLDFEEKMEEWNAARTPSSAAELVGAAFVHGRLDEVGEAADYLSRHPNSPGLLVEIPRRVLIPTTSDANAELSLRKDIRFLRDLLQLNLNNPFKWVDLARAYTTSGQLRKADRALRVALQLAPDDRFVLRSAVRFYLHLKRPDRAHALLLSSAAASRDPWLIGPEIAVAAMEDRRPELLKEGLKVLSSQNFPQSHLTELAATIGTHELDHGTLKRARLLMKQALVQPTENTVAQVRWAAKKVGGIEFDPKYLSVKRSFEARAWDGFYKGDWDASLAQSREWLDDQPFSSRPAVLGSFIASVVIEDHPEAIRLLRLARKANPKDGLLLNNLAYSLANMGEMDEAAKAIADIKGDGGELVTLKLATSGLLEFRKGNAESGRALYRQAYDRAQSAKLKELGTRVALFWAMHEVRSGFPISSEIETVALQSAEQSSDQVLQVLFRRIANASQRNSTKSQR